MLIPTKLATSAIQLICFANHESLTNGKRLGELGGFWILRLEGALVVTSEAFSQKSRFRERPRKLLHESTRNLLAEAMITELGVCRSGGRLKNGWLLN